MMRTARGETAKARIKFWLDTAEQEQELLLAEEKKSSLIQGRWDLAYAEVARFESWCASIRDTLDSLEYDEKRMALEKLGLRVYVFDHTQKPRYKFVRMPPKIGELVRQLSRYEIFNDMNIWEIFEVS